MKQINLLKIAIMSAERIRSLYHLELFTLKICHSDDALTRSTLIVDDIVQQPLVSPLVTLAVVLIHLEKTIWLKQPLQTSRLSKVLSELK